MNDLDRAIEHRLDRHVALATEQEEERGELGEGTERPQRERGAD